MEILSQYVLKHPNAQNVLDIFANEWSSAMPNTEWHTEPGKARLFDDPRLHWGIQTLGGVTGLKVLELGPLEGGHSYMLQNLGAQQVIAIEANTRSFLKCLCIKEILALDKVQYQLGDFVAFLKECTEQFDFVVASGVLYHMEEPIQLLELLAQHCEKLFLWTHYYDAKIINANANLKHKFQAPQTVEYQGKTYEICQQSYKDALNWAGFCGGSQPTSRWLSRDSLLASLTDLGFQFIQTQFEQPEHPNGPCLALCASKTPL